jgi:AAA+ superfamily predicted ATPase
MRQVDPALAVLVRRVRLRAEAALLRRLNAGYGFADPRAPSEMYLHDREARQRLSRDPLRSRDTHREALAAARDAIAEADAEALRLRSRLDELCDRLSLAPAERALLEVLAAYELDADVRALCQALAGARRPALYVDVCQEIAEALAPAEVALAALHPQGPVARLGLVVAAAGGAAMGRLDEAVAAGRRLLDRLVGEERVSGHLAGLIEAWPAGADLGVALPPQAERAAAEAESASAWILIGADGAGKRATALRIANVLGRPLLAGSLAELSAGGRELVDEALAEAAVRGAVAYFAGAEVVAPGREGESAALAALRDAPLPIVLASRSRAVAGVDLGRLARTVILPRPELDARISAWRRALAELGPGAELADDAAELLAARYVVGPATVSEATRDAARTARAETRAPSQADVEGALARRLTLNVGPLATRITRRARLDEMVVAEDVAEPLRDLIAMVRERSRILERWGYARHLGLSRGVSALFSGAPGTGKTMAASVISSELGLELFRVDLSAVVSKWVGETEKHLARIFDEAEDAEALLLFDEADSLFGKRTEVRGANDRYANLEVNYVLQRMEQFGGVSVLTTNQESGIDSAFMRRLNFRIRFPEPDAEEREALWRVLLPPGLDLEGGEELRRLAETFEMTGGHIRNAIVRAAVIAAREGREVRAKDLWTGAYREYVELGKVMPQPL